MNGDITVGFDNVVKGAKAYSDVLKAIEKFSEENVETLKKRNEELEDSNELLEKSQLYQKNIGKSLTNILSINTKVNQKIQDNQNAHAALSNAIKNSIVEYEKINSQQQYFKDQLKNQIQRYRNLVKDKTISSDIRDIEKKRLREAITYSKEIISNQSEVLKFKANEISFAKQDLTQMAKKHVGLQAQTSLISVGQKMASSFDSSRLMSAALSMDSMIEASAALGPEAIAAAIAIGAIEETVKLGIDRFVEIQHSSEAFRKETGLLISQTKILDSISLDINRNYMLYGVSLKDAYDASRALVGELGNVGIVENIKNASGAVTLLNKNFGVANEDAAGLISRMIEVGDATESGAVSAAVFAKKLSISAGVAPAKVMRDVARASGQSLSMIRGSNENLIKAATSAARLGTNLEFVSKSARSMLDFESSVNNELEASVLVGKNINFIRARQLAFAGDIEGSMRATLESIKSAGEFTKLNVFQQEALAKAAGMEVGELTKILRHEQLLSKMDVGKRKTYDELMAKKKSDVEGMDKAASDQLLKDAQMQSVMSNVNNIISMISNTFADLTSPFINDLLEDFVPFMRDMISKFVPNISEISKISKSIYLSIKPILIVFESMIEASLEILHDGLKPAFDMIGDIFGGTEDISKGIKEWMEYLKPITKLFVSAIQPSLVGMVLGLDLLVGIIKGGQKYLDGWKMQFKAIYDMIFVDFKSGFGELIESIKTMSMGIFGALITPFTLAWQSLREIWIGNSPSELGEGILRGITSIGDSLFNALITPFKRGYDFIVSNVPIFGSVLPKIIGTTTTNENPMNSPEISKPSPLQMNNDELLSKMDNFIDAQKELISLLKSGAIGINIDGRKMSQQLAYVSREA